MNKVDIFPYTVVFDCPECGGRICGPKATIEGALSLKLYQEIPDLNTGVKMVYHFEDKRPSCPYCGIKLDITIKEGNGKDKDKSVVGTQKELFGE